MPSQRQEIAPGIEVSPEVAGGTPVIGGTRIPIRAIIRALADLESIQEVARAYELNPEQAKQAIHYAADGIEEICVGVLT